MAVFTKLNQADIYNVQNIFGFKKITSFKGIKKGIENTNYFLSILLILRIKKVENLIILRVI